MKYSWLFAFINFLLGFHRNTGFGPQKNLFTVAKSMRLDLTSFDATVENRVSSDRSQPNPRCFYPTHEGRWKQRIELRTLKLGQRLVGTYIQGTELLEGKTGPKLFFECGIGRIDSKGRWQMVSGMLRLSNSKGTTMKPSVVRKKASRLQINPVELYVSKIRLDHGTLEVSTKPPESLVDHPSNTFRSASKLKTGDELIGTVTDVRSYGCIVDVGANRRGLLHIQKIAQFYGQYIQKDKGIIQAGLDKGTQVNVSVCSNVSKRLLLDFTRDGTESNTRTTNSEDEEDWEEYLTTNQSQTLIEDTSTFSADEQLEEYDEGEDEDEDRRIEDAFGLGSY